MVQLLRFLTGCGAFEFGKSNRDIRTLAGGHLYGKEKFFAHVLLWILPWSTQEEKPKLLMSQSSWKVTNMLSVKGFPTSMPSKSVESEHKDEPCRSAQQVLDPVSCF